MGNYLLMLGMAMASAVRPPIDFSIVESSCQCRRVSVVVSVEGRGIGLQLLYGRFVEHGLRDVRDEVELDCVPCTPLRPW